MQILRKTVLITGTTDGIGLALARRLSSKTADIRLILIGRRPLSTLHEIDPMFNENNYCQTDLFEPDCAAQITNWLDEQGVTQLDVVVHNAGAGYVGEIETQSADSIHTLNAVNFTAPVTLTHALLPYLKRSQHGQLLFVSSIVSTMATPKFAVYGATKAALDGFARNLRIELKQERNRVHVQVIHPGATKTGIHQKSGMDSSQKRFASPESVAKKIARAINHKRPPRTRTLGVANKLIRPIISSRLIDQVQMRGHYPEIPNRPLHCVITGAADGIGNALARRYATAGHRVTGIDIDQTRINVANNHPHISFIQADLTQDISWVDQLENVDVMIHNAGISVAGRFDQSDIATQIQVIALNLRAPMAITARLLANSQMVEGGSLLFISSLSHYMSYPGAAVYAGTKDGLAHYARSLRLALYPDQHVLTVFPGPIRTEHARRYSPDNSNEESRMLPSTLADAIYVAQQRRKLVLLPGAAAKIAARVGRTAPRLAEYGMRKMILDKF